MNCIKYRGRIYRPEVLFNKIRNNPEFYIKRHNIQLYDVESVTKKSFREAPLYSLLQPSDFDKDGNVKPEILAEIQAERERIVSEAKANGIYMKALNGQPTNLNEEQWITVRTSRFKEWFGDWENNPDNASKAVDDNGEPKVVSHSTNNNFTEFINTQETDSGWLGKGFYFFGDRSLDGQYGKNVMEVFLNVREPYYISEDEYLDLADKDDKEYSEEFSDNIANDGYDAVYYNGNLNQEWNVFNSNQIKSATDNVGTYSEDSDDIRYHKKMNTPESVYEKFKRLDEEIITNETKEDEDLGTLRKKLVPKFVSLWYYADNTDPDVETFGSLKEATKDIFEEGNMSDNTSDVPYKTLSVAFDEVWIDEHDDEVDWGDEDVSYDDVYSILPDEIKELPIGDYGMIHEETFKSNYEREQEEENSHVYDKDDVATKIRDFLKDRKGFKHERAGYAGSSHYFTYETDSGKKMLIRVADHNFNHNNLVGKNFKNEDEIPDNVVSIVIQNKVDSQEVKRFESAKSLRRREFFENTEVEQYIYDIEDINNAGGVEEFAEYLIENIDNVENGDFFRDDHGIEYQIIGEKGAEQLDHAEEVTHRMDNLAIAREMEKAGKDAKTIRMATGWERGADDKWRYEIEDLEFKTNRIPLPKITPPYYPKLKNLINNKLLDAYPTLGDIYVVIQSDEAFKFKRSPMASGFYVAQNINGDKEIWIKEDIYYNKEQPKEILDEIKKIENSKEYKDFIHRYTEEAKKHKYSWKSTELKKMTEEFNNTEIGSRLYRLQGDEFKTEISKQFKSILIHEIQHAIQEIEGFANGGNVRMFKDITNRDVANDLSSQANKIFESQTEEWKKKVRAINEAKIQKDFDKVEKLETDFYNTESKEHIRAYDEYSDLMFEARIYMENPDQISKTASEQYESLQGEVEARNVQSRMNMTAEERRKKLLSETEDVAREDQIFLASNEKAFSENSQVVRGNPFSTTVNNSRRNATLSDNGVPTDPQQKRKNIIRFVKNTFQSDRGLQREVANAIRSLGFERSALTSVLEYDAQVLKKISQKYTKGKNKQEANQQLKAINQYLQGDKNTANFLSDQDKNSLDVLRMRIDENSGRIIQTLNDKIERLKDKLNNPDVPKVSRANIEQVIKNTESLIKIIEQNKGNYMKRSYQAFHDPNYLNALLAENDEVSKRLINNAVQYLVDQSSDLFGSKLSEAQARSKIFEYIDRLRQKSTDFAPPFTFGGINAPFFKKRNNELPQVFRELLGEIHDPLTNYINTMHSSANYLAAVTYQKELSEVLIDLGIGSYQAEKGMTRLSAKGDRWEMLQDIWVPTEIKEAIEDLQPLDSISDFGKYWVKLSAWTKVMKTVYSPTTMMRNIWSGFFLGFNAGFQVFNPKSISALKMAWGGGMSKAEIRLEKEKLLRLGVIGDGAVSGEILQLMNDYQTANHSSKKGMIEKSLTLAQKLYAIGDDFFKTAGFYTYKERYMKSGLSESQAEKKAAERMADTYPTYSRLPKNIRHLRRFPLAGTFVSFPYEAIRTTTNTLKYIAEDIYEAKKTGNKQRWVMAMQSIAGIVMATTFPVALNFLGKALSGITNEEEEAILDSLPDYQTNANLLFLGNENGMPVFMDMTAFFPSEVWVKPLRVLVENRESRDVWDKLANSGKELLNPYYSEDIMTKTLRELIINNENQYGQSIYKGNNIFQGIWNSPKEVAQHFLKQAGPGVYNNFTEFMKANEIAPELFGEKHTNYGKEYTNKEAVLGLLGFRLTTLNMGVSLKYASQQLKREVSDEHSKINRQVIYQRELSDDNLQAMVEEKAMSHRKYYDKLFLSVACAKRFEMKDEDIKSILKGSGYSNTDANRVINTVYPKINEVSIQTLRKKKKEIQITYAHDKEKAQQFVATYLKNIERYNQFIRKENQKMNDKK
ncbi:ADP-ribosyltransferase-containing protein [Capnocytophaga canis]|uniref:ADP-ribosyltransferase-containing protein n=1 Tax=Capnocytophaga canis TaxID=1848903 RepID=UPI0037D2116D